MLVIKPHHFMDIIKLYGKGIEVFLPDSEYHHNFYAVANEIIQDHQTIIEVTIDWDDICAPCKHLGNDGKCRDSIKHIEIGSKDEWNKILDRRMMNYLNVSVSSSFTAQEFCQRLYRIKEHIFDIWQEEDSVAQTERYHYFCTGAQKYLGLAAGNH